MNEYMFPAVHGPQRITPSVFPLGYFLMCGGKILVCK
jgi:hypothetical protein